MDHTQYRYEPIDLGEKAIRLIRICSGEYTEPLRCEIFQTYLDPDNGIPYEALSWAWGNPNITKVPLKILTARHGSLTCLWILPNLYQILQHFRHHKRDRIVWVDAIRIDQARDHNAVQE